MKQEFNVTNHSLTPKHVKLTEAEAKKFLERNNFKKQNLPKIFLNDPAIAHLKPEIGDIIKIERQSATAGTAYFYRVVSND